MTSAPHLDRARLRAGTRVAIAVSGGADSVGLLRALIAAAPEIGLVLTVAHVHHGIRGPEADQDASFVAELADRHRLTCEVHRVDTPALAQQRKLSLEEAARELRYAWFRELLSAGKADVVATAHTLDDQAETVLHRLLRGAWTEGLAGIYPHVICPGGEILRPFLHSRRAEIVAWLRHIGQPWREDTSNADLAFTRNRIRHEVLPLLAGVNPRVEEQLAHLAAIARDEESWWDEELRRILPGLLLPGRPVRGGGRAVSTNPDERALGIELERLRALAPAVRRRVLRAAAEHLGASLDFEQTQRLMDMCGTEGPRRQQLTAEMHAERTPRELRLERKAAPARTASETFELPIPGEIAGLGICLRTRIKPDEVNTALAAAVLRGPKPGDRVQIRYSRGPKPLKEIFERMKVDAYARKNWPLVEWEGRIVWMKDVALEPDPQLPFVIEMQPEEAESQ